MLDLKPDESNTQLTREFQLLSLVWTTSQEVDMSNNINHWQAFSSLIHVGADSELKSSQTIPGSCCSTWRKFSQEKIWVVSIQMNASRGHVVRLNRLMRIQQRKSCSVSILKPVYKATKIKSPPFSEASCL
jgi:hypothetical protein